MESAAEVRRNLHELQNLRAMASRPFVQGVLDREIGSCQKRLDELQASVTKSSLNGSATSSVDNIKQYSAAVPLPTVKITNYAWDQSDKYVKIYLTIPDVNVVSVEQINTNFAENHFDLNIVDVGGKNYALVMKGLLHEIDPKSSYIKQKTDSLLLMLKKKNEALKWEHLTKAEMSKKAKNLPSLEKDADPQESLMNMMKQIYEDGDDDLKRTIRKAWYESQTKKAEGLEKDF